MSVLTQPGTKQIQKLKSSSQKYDKGLVKGYFWAVNQNSLMHGISASEEKYIRW